MSEVGYNVTGLHFTASEAHKSSIHFAAGYVQFKQLVSNEEMSSDQEAEELQKNDKSGEYAQFFNDYVITQLSQMQK